MFDEVYHDFVAGPWVRRNWFVAAVDLPITRHLTLQPSYIRQDDQFLRSVNFLGLGLIIKTDPLVQRVKSIASPWDNWSLTVADTKFE